MFTWLKRCWGGVGVTNSFEKARIAATFPDWQASDPNAISCKYPVIQCHYKPSKDKTKR